MGDERQIRRRFLIAALLLSAALHLALFLGLQRVALPVRVSQPKMGSIELSIEETVRPAPTLPTAKAPAEESTEEPTRAGSQKLTTVSPPAAAQGEVGSSIPSGSLAQAGNARATEVPHKLDLALHRPVELASPGGETFHNLPGEGLPEDHRPSSAQSRLDGWIETDSARRRVAKGLVDDWFEGLRKSLDRALAKNPPPPPPVGALAREMAKGYLASASAYGRSGTPGTPSGPDTSVSAPPADLGASAGIIPFSQPRLSLGPAAQETSGLWAIIELQYGPGGKLTQSKVLSSSGDARFDSHVIKVVALGLPGLPDLPDGGLGIHATGTRSVWEVDGHISFERDLKTVNLKDDAWYLPIAAATALAGAGGGSFDEVSGYVGFTDLRHAHLKCEVKLLEVY